MVYVLGLSGFVVLALIWLIGTAISRKLGALILVVYLLGFLAIVTGNFPGVVLG